MKQKGEDLTPGLKPSVKSEDLFQGSREVVIEHAREKYRLIITKAGKLILNK